jgi:membrane protein
VSEPSPPVENDAVQQDSPVYVRTWRGLARTVGPTLHFLMETEAHVYAFSIAANVLLSFFPFLLTMVLLCRGVFHWEAGVQAILFAVSKCFPDYHHGIYIDIAGALREAARGNEKISLISLLILFFTANGIFEPLEVALNRAWRVPKNRSFFRNQLVSLGLVFLCGALVLLSTVLLVWNGDALTHTLNPAVPAHVAKTLVFKVVSVPLSMLIIFAAYWILPNRKIPVRRLIPVSVIVGLLLSVLQYLILITWPWLLAKLKTEAGPFLHSSSIILWSFCAALIVLAGAEWSARVSAEEHVSKEQSAYDAGGTG